MDSDFCRKLAAALGIEPVPPPGPVQQLFNRSKKNLIGRTINSPKEEVHLLSENFPYWIKLENPNPANTSEWIPAKSSIVVPMLEAGIFDETGFRFDPTRANALFNVPELLGAPNCIHRNLRNHKYRGEGGIKGDYIYVRYYGRERRKVAFTTMNKRLGVIVLVTSFWTNKKWVEECCEMPALFVRSGCKCECKEERPQNAASPPITPGPEYT
jgi:hypothetical protein